MSACLCFCLFVCLSVCLRGCLSFCGLLARSSSSSSSSFSSLCNCLLVLLIPCRAPFDYSIALVMLPGRRCRCNVGSLCGWSPLFFSLCVSPSLCVLVCRCRSRSVSPGACGRGSSGDAPGMPALAPELQWSAQGPACNRKAQTPPTPNHKVKQANQIKRLLNVMLQVSVKRSMGNCKHYASSPALSIHLGRNSFMKFSTNVA